MCRGGTWLGFKLAITQTEDEHATTVPPTRLALIVFVLTFQAINTSETYWVSCGCEYFSKKRIWVGQASFQYSETYTVSIPYWSILGELWVRVLLQEEDLGGTGPVPVLRYLHCKYTILIYTGYWVSCGCEYFSKKRIWVGQASFQYSDTYTVSIPYWSILGELWVRVLLQEEDLGGTSLVPVLRDLYCKYTILIYTGWAVGGVLLQEEDLGRTGLFPVLRDLHCKYTILIYTGWAGGCEYFSKKRIWVGQASFQYSETYTVSIPYWSILGWAVGASTSPRRGSGWDRPRSSTQRPTL